MRSIIREGNRAMTQQQRKLFHVECHCGNVKIAVEKIPDEMTSCNCSICNRLGALWAYYDGETVKVMVGEKPQKSYSWNEKTIDYHRCSECGCTTHYSRKEAKGRVLIAINCRMAELPDVSNIPVRKFDGLVAWEYLDGH